MGIFGFMCFLLLMGVFGGVGAGVYFWLISSIAFTFKNGNDDTVEFKTRFIYTASDAEKLAEMGSFPIKYKGEKAVIITDKFKK